MGKRYEVGYIHTMDHIKKPILMNFEDKKRGLITFPFMRTDRQQQYLNKPNFINSYFLN